MKCCRKVLSKLEDQNVVYSFKKNDCDCTTCSKVYAYVDPFDIRTHTIVLCRRFWKAHEVGHVDIKAGTLFHEFTHFKDFYKTTDVDDVKAFGKMVSTLSCCMPLNISYPKVTKYVLMSTTAQVKRPFRLILIHLMFWFL